MCVSMKIKFGLHLKLGLVALVVALMAHARADAGITLDGSGKGEVPTGIPAAAFPVVDNDTLQSATSSATSSGEPDDVLTRIVSNGAHKSGAPSVLSELTKLGSENGKIDAQAGENFAESVWMVKPIQLLWLGVLSVGAWWIMRLRRRFSPPALEAAQPQIAGRSKPGTPSGLDHPQTV